MSKSDLSISKEFENISNAYVGQLRDSVFEISKEICNEGKSIIKTIPSQFKSKRAKGRAYKSSYTVISENTPVYSGSKLWNSDYRLSHLINDGHKIKNQYGGPYKKKNGATKTIGYQMWDITKDKLEKAFEEKVVSVVQKISK